VTPLTFTHPVRVRWNECDPQGIVFNANYLLYVDLAVTEFWRGPFGSYQRFVAETGVDVVLADVQLRFRGSARFDDEIAITLEPAMTSASSLTMRSTIDRGADRLIEGTSRYACVDARTLAKRPAPSSLLEVLNAQPD
jgi:acyl-CoA thioester hydrolase